MEKNSIIAFFLIVNLILIVLIRKTSLREGGIPPGLHINSFFRYVYKQSKESENNKLKILIYCEVICFALTFLALLFFNSG
ncbi:MAG: hypothetical protein GY860_20035 [Desulfobacteraceae bacterium]|nr:hypothetical protein [Desulfobacteraceae bacterium]